MIEAFQTLDNGTLVDFAIDDRQYLTIRAGDSLTPAHRPVVLELTPADIMQLIHIIRALYESHPVDLVLQHALESHRRGATHDCGEWEINRHCRICQRELGDLDG